MSLHRTGQICSNDPPFLPLYSSFDCGLRLVVDHLDLNGGSREERAGRLAPFGGDIRNGYIAVDDRRLVTNESGVVLLTVDSPGLYTATYHPGSWLSHNPAYVRETLSAIHNRAADTFGVPESTAPTTQTPAAVREVLSVTDDKLDVALAKVVRSLQLRDGVREENGEVGVEQVDQELRRLFEDVEIDPPSYDELADIRKRTRFLETSVDLDVDEVVVRLTAAGEDVATPDTGGVQAAGGSGHDDALLQIEEELTTLGFTVSILSQDGSEKPDGRATSRTGRNVRY